MLQKFLLVDGTTLEVKHDTTPEDPRVHFQPMGNMICFHTKYLLGDEHDYRTDDFAGWEDMKKKLTREHNIAVILPLYLYDHGSITMSTTPFSCPWDSGQVGFIYVTKATAREEYKVSRMSKKVIEKVTKNLLAEVETYDNYLTGAVYGYQQFDANGNEIDSCWGFYGDDPKTNGILEGKEVLQEL
jgi:hypothetical protein